MVMKSQAKLVETVPGLMPLSTLCVRRMERRIIEARPAGISLSPRGPERFSAPEPAPAYESLSGESRVKCRAQESVNAREKHAVPLLRGSGDLALRCSRA